MENRKDLVRFTGGYPLAADLAGRRAVLGAEQRLFGPGGTDAQRLAGLAQAGVPWKVKPARTAR